MAAALPPCCSGLPEPRFSLALLAFWCTFVGSGSAVRVIQTPNFVSGSIGENIIFHCSVDGIDYNFFWYRQLPGKTELEVVGSLYTYSKDIEEFPEKLKDRLKAEQTKSANPPKWEMRLELLNLQASDTGFYLCAVVYTVKKKEIVAGAKLSIRSKSALYSFLFIFSFYLMSIGNPLLHPSDLIFKTVFGQFVPFKCPDLHSLHGLWDNPFDLNQTCQTQGPETRSGLQSGFMWP